MLEGKCTMYKHWDVSVLHIPNLAYLTCLDCSTTAMTIIDKQIFLLKEYQDLTEMESIHVVSSIF